MPAHFGKAEKAAWEFHLKLLADMRVLTSADAGALEACCLAYTAMNEAYRQLREEGLTQLNDLGQLRKHPAAGIAAESNRIYQSWLARFGLSPADRSRVSAIPADAKQSGWALLKRG